MHSNLRSDLKYALRQLRRTPGFTAATILTLALGIGANSAIFSVVNAVLLRPLPFDPDNRLVMLENRDPAGRRLFVSAPDFEDWRSQSRSFQAVGCWVGQSVNLTGLDEPTRIIGVFASANFFDVVGIKPALGRSFLPGDDRPGVPRETIISHAVWQGRFAGDKSALGKTMILNGEPYTIVGVTPRDFEGPYFDADAYLPLPYYPNYNRERSRASCGGVARLKADVTLEQAQAEMTTIGSGIAAQFPDTHRGLTIRVTEFREQVIAGTKPIIVSLLGAVGFVLLIGCANVANLVISRVVSRSRETAVRTALGASRGRLISQILSETLLLGFAGGGLGLLLGIWGVAALKTGGAAYLPGGMNISLDRTVLVFTLGLSIVTGLLVALIPVLQLMRADWGVVLRSGRNAGSAGRNRTRNALVVCEIALALVLLVGSGLMIRTFLELGRVAPGYDASNLLTMEYRLPRNKYPKGEQQAGFHREVVQRVKSLPGVVSATSIRALPFSGNGGGVGYIPADRTTPDRKDLPRAMANFADPDYFATMRIPILRGRGIEERDQPSSPMVVVINQTLARRHWPGEDPIGKHLRFPELNISAEIVGVAGDVKHYRLEDPETPQLYGSIAQNPFIFSTLVVRTHGDPMQMSDAVRKTVWNVDKDQPVWKVRSLDSMIQNSISPRRFVMFLLSGYSGIALLLAAIGIFGVVSYSVGQRTPEIGVRMALGAQPKHVLRMVLGHGLIMALTGIALGSAGAVGLTRFLRTQLYGVENTDPLIYSAVAGVLALVALAACLIPARRAVKVDPTVALRYE